MNFHLAVREENIYTRPIVFQINLPIIPIYYKDMQGTLINK